MKRKLVSIGALLWVTAATAQVGIGTVTPNKSAELTIVSKDKGILIPNIALKNTVDRSSISNGNIESLLVYANVEQEDIQPGFYYWDKERWVRLVSDADIQDGNVYYDGFAFTYTAVNGVKQTIDVASLVKLHETKTTLVNNNNGTYTYTSEDGTKTTIDVPRSVMEEFETILNNETVKNHIVALITRIGGGNVYYDGLTFKYTDDNGIAQIIDVSALVKLHETKTTLVNNNNGTYTYTAEDGIQTVINVPQSVVEEFEIILNNETVKNQIVALITRIGGGNVHYDGITFKYTDANGVPQVIDVAAMVKLHETNTTLEDQGNGMYTYTAENGMKTSIDIPSIVKISETKTTLVYNGNGTYTYTAEDGIQTLIDVPQSVMEEFETILNNETVKNQIVALITRIGGGNVHYDGTTFTYKDANGVDQTIDLASLVKLHETKTTLVDNGNGTYTYTAEDGIQTRIDVPQSVVHQFEQIIKNETVLQHLKQLINKTGGNVYYDGLKFEYVYDNGVRQIIDISALVKSSETLTTLVDNGNATYTYTAENGTRVTIDVPQSVIEKFETIIKNEAVINHLEQIVKNSGGNVYYDGLKFEYMNQDGVKQVINFSSIIRDHEALTTLIDNRNGTYTYTAENGIQTIIEDTLTVLAYNPITGMLTYKDEHKNIVTVDVKDAVKKFETVTSILSNATAGTLEFKDEDGGTTVLDIKEIVKKQETVTKLVNNNNNTYTFYNEKEIDAAGNPIANKGTTFRIPSPSSFDLTQSITTGTFTERSWSYDKMIANRSISTYYVADASFSTLFLGTLKVNTRLPNATRMLNVNCQLYSLISTIGVAPTGNPYLGKVEVEASIEMELYINGVLVHDFTRKYFRYGGPARGVNFWEEDYAWNLQIPNHITLNASNTIEIKAKPTRNNFNLNEGTGNGYFFGTMNVFNVKLEKVSIQLFEKIGN